MTPTQLASALRDVEIANEETNYAKFQSDCAIRDDAAKALETMTIECKDLEWSWDEQAVKSQSVKGVEGYYFVYYFDQRDAFEVHYQPYNGNYHHRVYIGTRDSFTSAQAAANDHNKQQFQQIIDEWRKG